MFLTPFFTSLKATISQEATLPARFNDTLVTLMVDVSKFDTNLDNFYTANTVGVIPKLDKEIRIAPRLDLGVVKWSESPLRTPPSSFSLPSPRLLGSVPSPRLSCLAASPSAGSSSSLFSVASPSIGSS